MDNAPARGHLITTGPSPHPIVIRVRGRQRYHRPQPPKRLQARCQIAHIPLRHLGLQEIKRALSFGRDGEHDVVSRRRERRVRLRPVRHCTAPGRIGAVFLALPPILLCPLPWRCQQQPCRRWHLLAERSFARTRPHSLQRLTESRVQWAFADAAMVVGGHSVGIHVFTPLDYGEV